MAEDTQTSTSDAMGDAAIRRADALFDQAGQRLGVFAVQARMRLQALAAQSAQAAQGAANRTAQAMNHSASDDGANQTNQADQDGASARAAFGAAPEPMDRAEVLVDAAGQRLSALGQATNQRLQVLFAHLREEGEDIWAEAQTIRRPDTPTQ